MNYFFLPFMLAALAVTVVSVLSHARAGRQRDQRQNDVGASEPNAIRPFSVYLNGEKCRTNQSADLSLSDCASVLILRQLVPTVDVSSARAVSDAFKRGAKIDVACGLIAGETMSLGGMEVTNIAYATDHRKGTLVQVACLQGPSLQRKEATGSDDILHALSGVTESTDGERQSGQEPS